MKPGINLPPRPDNSADGFGRPLAMRRGDAENPGRRVRIGAGPQLGA